MVVEGSATSVLRWAAKVSTWGPSRVEGVGCALAGRRHAPHPAGRDGDRLDPRCRPARADRLAVRRNSTRACPHHSGDTVRPGDCAGRRELRVSRSRKAGSVLLHQDRAPGRPSRSAEWRTLRTTRGSADRGTHRRLPIASGVRRAGCPVRRPAPGGRGVGSTSAARPGPPGPADGRRGARPSAGRRPGVVEVGLPDDGEGGPSEPVVVPAVARVGRYRREIAAPTSTATTPAPMAHGLDDLVGGVGGHGQDS